MHEGRIFHRAITMWIFCKYHMVFGVIERRARAEAIWRTLLELGRP
jgi:hypothetical protein